jgi:hypothetical protein
MAKKNMYLARAIAFYLPQYHPIPENDDWWGKGFTEWTNAAKAKPMFPGHYQPHIPADLGFYDLRVPETRKAQAEMAREHGIEAFCYYHYWFAGKRLLERPFNEVLESGEPDFPFCLCWANQSWSGIWHGSPERTLIQQTYPGIEDYRRHFDFLLKAFMDKRYVTVEQKPLFLIWHPFEVPNIRKVIESWREMAANSGLKGLYLIGFTWDSAWIPQEHGFDASINEQLPHRKKHGYNQNIIERIICRFKDLLNFPEIYSYKKILPKLLPNHKRSDEYFCVIPNWDNTPRSGKNGIVFKGSTPDLFRIYFRKALKLVDDLPLENRLIFIKSWNEWAEGNHLEPDLRHGKAYLKVIKDEIIREQRLKDKL